MMVKLGVGIGLQTARDGSQGRYLGKDLLKEPIRSSTDNFNFLPWLYVVSHNSLGRQLPH